MIVSGDDGAVATTGARDVTTGGRDVFTGARDVFDIVTGKSVFKIDFFGGVAEKVVTKIH